MAFYAALICFSVAVWFLASNLKSERSKFVCFAIVGLVLFGVMGVRDSSVGTDTSHYIDSFSTARYLSWGGMSSSHYEPLFYSFFLLVGAITDDGNLFILVESFITGVLMMRFVWRHSKSPLASLVLFQLFYFYCSSFNISRVWLGTAIALVGYDYVVQKKAKQAIFFPILGMLFHLSVVVLVPLYLLMAKKKPISDAGLILVIGLSIALIPFSQMVLSLVVYLFPRYQVYLEIDSGISSGFLLPSFMGIILLGSLLVIEKNAAKAESDEARRLCYPVTFGVCILILSSVFPMASRVVQVCLVFVIVLIPKIGFLKYGKVFGGAVSLLACGYWYMQIQANSGEVVPYESWLF